MRRKIPRKKSRWSLLTGLLLIWVFPCLSTASPDTPAGNLDRALFWSIEKNGRPAGHVLGTIHSEDPRVLEFSEDFLEKLRSDAVFAMELVPNLPNLARLTEYMHYPPGESLESVLGSERFRAVESALAGYQVPAEFISRMKPWAAMMTLSTPPPKTGFFMDLSLSLRASGNGLEVIGLESLEQQLSFLENMPMPMQLSLLDAALSEFEHVQQAHDLMLEAYLGNDLVALQALTDEQFLSVGEAAGEYFLEEGIRARNRRMADTLWPYLEKGRVFVAVGALHLPGEAGLLNLLRGRGYRLKPMPMPFPEAQAGTAR